MASALVYSTRSGVGSARDIVERIHAASQPKPLPDVRVCLDMTVEPHLAGEFPMDCRQCHIVVNVEGDFDDVEEMAEDNWPFFLGE